MTSWYANLLLDKVAEAKVSDPSDVLRLQILKAAAHSLAARIISGEYDEQSRGSFVRSCQTYCSKQS